MFVVVSVVFVVFVVLFVVAVVFVVVFVVVVVVAVVVVAVVVVVGGVVAAAAASAAAAVVLAVAFVVVAAVAVAVVALETLRKRYSISLNKPKFPVVYTVSISESLPLNFFLSFNCINMVHTPQTSPGNLLLKWNLSGKLKCLPFYDVIIHKNASNGDSTEILTVPAGQEELSVNVPINVWVSLRCVYSTV